MVFKNILNEYPELFSLNGNNYSEYESIRAILNCNSQGSRGQKSFFNLMEKYIAIKKLFALGLRESAVDACINDVFDQAISQRDYHICQDIARLLYQHFKLYEDADTAAKYKNLRDTFSSLLKLEYETEDVYFELVNSQQLPLKIDQDSIDSRLEAIKSNLEAIRENFNFESSTYMYYYYLGKCLMGKSDEESLEFILEGLEYFQDLYFKHEIYINTFRFYHTYYFFRKELFDVCLNKAQEYFKYVKVGGPAWHKYLDLMAKCHLAQDERLLAHQLAQTSKNHVSFKSLPKINRERIFALIDQIHF